MFMVIRKAFKYRLKTKPEDELLLRQFAGSCRFVWNKALALQKERLDQDERFQNYSQLTALLPAWKVEFPFLKEVHSQPIQQTLKNLDRALKDAFRRTRMASFLGNASHP
jgi:putative transposase